MPRVTESRYETKQEAPFYRVNPRKAAAGRPNTRGIREEARQAGTVGGPAGGDVPQPISDEALRDLIDDPGNFVRRAADDYTQRLFDKPYERPTMPVSSLAKQSSIGRAFMSTALSANWRSLPAFTVALAGSILSDQSNGTVVAQAPRSA